MDYVNNFLKNVLKHQNFGGMDFEWRDKNLFICVLKMNNCTVGLEQHEN